MGGNDGCIITLAVWVVLKIRTSHNIEHELSALYDCAHGAGLAVVMPAVFTYNLKHDVMRFAKVAVRVWALRWILNILKLLRLRVLTHLKALFKINRHAR